MRRAVWGAVAAWLGCAGGAGGEGEGGETAAPPGTSGGATTSGATSTTGDASTGPAPTTGADPGTTGTGPDATTGTGTSGDTGDESSTGPAGGCGDAEVQAPELCDDGNAVDGDGCNADCMPSGRLLWSAGHAGGLGLADEGMGCAVDAAGSVYVAGYVGVAMGDEDAWVRKYAYDGAEMWTQTHAGATMLREHGRALVVDEAELAVVAGFENVAMQGNDVWLRKFAAEGTPQWTKGYDDPDHGNDAGYALARTGAGELVAVGGHAVPGQGQNMWLRKHDAAGNTLWTRSYAGAAGGSDTAYAVAAGDGYLYVAGAETVAAEGLNMWLGKYDADGNLLWSRGANGAASADDLLFGAAATADGGVVVCGYQSAAEVPWTSFVRRYDADGLVVWTEVDDGPMDAGALCYAVALTADGEVVTAGAAIRDKLRKPYVRRLAADGTPRWGTLVDSPGAGGSQARCVAVGPGDEVVAAGGLDMGTDGRDVWIGRFAP